jgi:hypothetical protein
MYQSHANALSSRHHEHSISDENNKFKPDIILDYKKTKSGVDILDKSVREYTCPRGTKMWPLSLFLNYVDIASSNAFVILKMNVDGARDMQPLIKQRKQFLETLRKHPVRPNIDRRRERIECNGRGYQSSMIRAIVVCGEKMQKRRRSSNGEETRPKRGRSGICVGNDNKYSVKWQTCLLFLCKNHSNCTTTVVCTNCQNR